MRVGRTENGLAEFREALRIGPPSVQLYTNLGAALATLQRVREAETAVRAALQLDATDSKARYLLGHMLAVQPGREKEALENLMRAETQVPAARIVTAEVLLRTGDRTRAAAEVHAYLELPDRAYRQQAEMLLQRIRQ